jgi:fructokinase
MPVNPHNARKVFALGETVLDLILDGGFGIKAVAGGSVVNASVSLGRMGIEVQLISEFGADKTGTLINGFLSSNGVLTDFCTRYPNHKTSLALAFLDSAKNATYTFYTDTPEKLNLANIPVFQNSDILLFGSFYSVRPNRRNVLQNILQKAVDAKSVIYYDLNIRKAHSDQMDILMPSFMNNISVATIVKGSDEDFMNLFGIDDPAAVYEKISPYCKTLIFTNGSKPVQVFTPKFHLTYKVPEINPVSTIGAGDNFNAGFIFGLVTSGFGTKNSIDMPMAELDRMVACGLAFASVTCLSFENYIPGKFEPDFWKKYI